MTSSANAEPKGSEPSSTDPCECGHMWASHHWHAARGEACIGNRNLCSCRLFRVKPKVVLPPRNWAHLCTCGHVRGSHPENASHECELCDCAEFRCDHSRCGWKPREDKPEPRCEGCGHPQHAGFCRELEMSGSPGDVDECGCLDDREPPMTPEEEEQACETGDMRTCTTACPVHGMPGERAAEDEGARLLGNPDFIESVKQFARGEKVPLDDEPPPPQPLRRLPYRVSYSVLGHLYEVALPGDASAFAVDGALIIKHNLGPVAGICYVQPMEGEGS